MLAPCLSRGKGGIAKLFVNCRHHRSDGFRLIDSHHDHAYPAGVAMCLHGFLEILSLEKEQDREKLIDITDLTDDFECQTHVVPGTITQSDFIANLPAEFPYGARAY